MPMIDMSAPLMTGDYSSTLAGEATAPKDWQELEGGVQEILPPRCPPHSVLVSMDSVSALIGRISRQFNEWRCEVCDNDRLMLFIQSCYIWVVSVFNSQWFIVLAGKVLPDIGAYTNTLIQFPMRAGYTPEGSAFSPSSLIEYIYFVASILSVSLMSYSTFIAYVRKLQEIEGAVASGSCHNKYEFLPWAAGGVRSFAKAVSFILMLQELFGDLYIEPWMYVCGSVVLVANYFSESTTLVTAETSISQSNFSVIGTEPQIPTPWDAWMMRFRISVTAAAASLSNFSLYWISLLKSPDHFELPSKNKKNESLALGSALYLTINFVETFFINYINIAVAMTRQMGVILPCKIVAPIQEERMSCLRHRVSYFLPVVGVGLVVYGFCQRIGMPMNRNVLLSITSSLIHVLMLENRLRYKDSGRLLSAALPQTIVSLASLATLLFTGSEHVMNKAQSRILGILGAFSVYSLAVKCCYAKFAEAWKKVEKATMLHMCEDGNGELTETGEEDDDGYNTDDEGVGNNAVASTAQAQENEASLETDDEESDGYKTDDEGCANGTDDEEGQNDSDKEESGDLAKDQESACKRAAYRHRNRRRVTNSRVVGKEGRQKDPDNVTSDGVTSDGVTSDGVTSDPVTSGEVTEDVISEGVAVGVTSEGDTEGGNDWDSEVCSKSPGLGYH